METEGTFLVTHAESESAVLTDVGSGRVHTLSENPELAAGDVLVGTLAADPPMEVTWSVTEVSERRSLSVAASDESPTTQEHDIAAETPEGELTRQPRADYGELHVICVPPEEVEGAVADVVEDEATLVRAAGMEQVTRVEVRSSVEEGFLSVRYLP